MSITSILFCPFASSRYIAEAAPVEILNLLGKVAQDALSDVIQGVSLVRIDKVFEINVYVNSQTSPPQPALISFQEGVEQAKQNNYIGAISYYTDALRQDGSFIEAYASRGLAYSEIKDYQAAIEDFEESIEINHKFVEPYLGLGSVHIEQGDYQAALDDFTKAIKTNRNYVEGGSRFCSSWRFCYSKLYI